jgi:hypothetical protein
MKIDGGCDCGYITYEAEADPEKTTICRYTDCQHLAFRTCARPEGADLDSLALRWVTDLGSVRGLDRQ